MNCSAHQRGMSLIELIVSIVIVSISAAAVLGVLAQNVGASADPMLQHQALAVAESYIEEISLKPIDDPDGVGGEAVRADFDDVDDYDGLVDVGAADQFGNPVAGLADYSVSVAVSPSSALTGVAAADSRRIDVRVVRPPDIDFVLSVYRTRF